ncbi:MAG: hypothetical protein R2991_03785 [Thermoanaerobaculia bacterium]
MDDLFDTEPARRTEPSERVEQGLVLAANAIWAVVGLVLWLPQIARVILTSAWRLVHGALTRQGADAARGPIRRVSRFYVDGFMGLKGPPAGQTTYSSRDLRLRRLLGEALWAAAFYLAVLRLLSPERFERAWARLTTAAAWTLDALADLLVKVWSWLPEGVRQVGDLTLGLKIAFAVLVLLGVAGGWILGRRR